MENLSIVQQLHAGDHDLRYEAIESMKSWLDLYWSSELQSLPVSELQRHALSGLSAGVAAYVAENIPPPDGEQPIVDIRDMLREAWAEVTGFMAEQTRRKYEFDCHVEFRVFAQNQKVEARLPVNRDPDGTPFRCTLSTDDDAVSFLRAFLVRERVIQAAERRRSDTTSETTDDD